MFDCDFIGEICGGDSFSDIYGIRRFIFTVIPDIIAIFLNKSLILLPQTYGPYKSLIAKKIAYFIIKVLFIFGGPECFEYLVVGVF